MLDDVTRLKRGIPAECAEFFGFRDWSEIVEFAESDEGESLRSFVSIVCAFGEGALIQRLKSVEREESSADLIISTGHKAKGREWDSVALHSDFDPRPSKDDPNKFVLNQEEARLLYVATTRAKELLVVPPRLAAKWGVPLASPGPQVQIPVKAAPALPKKAPPELPSFAKVVSPMPEPSATTVVGRHSYSRNTPNVGVAPTTEPPAALPMGEHEKPQVKQSTAVATGLVAALVGFLFG